VVEEIQYEGELKQGGREIGQVQRIGKYPMQSDHSMKKSEILKENLNHLNQEEKEVIKHILCEYQHLFKKTKGVTFSCSSYGCHEIKKGDALPVKKQPYRVPMHLGMI
jgi:hypothetical protein